MGLAAGLMLAVPAQATVINADTVSASSVFNSNYLAENTINGSGLGGADLNVVDPTTIAHDDYAEGNHWTTSGSSPTDQWIRWAFDTDQTLGGIYVWNHRSNVISANSGYEPTLFDLTLYDSSDAVLLNLNNVALLPDTAVAQLIGFNTLVSGISSILFEIEAVQSSPSYTGLAEVRFETDLVSSVPLPAALPLLAGALGALGLIGRRRRTAAA